MRNLLRMLAVVSALAGAALAQQSSTRELADAPSTLVTAAMAGSPADLPTDDTSRGVTLATSGSASQPRLEPQLLPHIARPAYHVISSRTCASGEATAKQCREHWAPLLRESFAFLLIQAGGNVASDKQMRYDTFHGHWMQHWFESAANTEFTHWNDGDSGLASYVSHPMMGSTTDFLYIQNDPKARDLGFQNTRQYWMSRLRAMAFSTVYSAEWKVGPISEASVGNTGRKMFYSKDSHGMTNGTGAVDFVITPIGGTVWSVGEDLIDREIIWRLEAKTNNRAALLGFSVLNPTRSLANLLRGKAPWYRDSRETRVPTYALPFRNLPRNLPAAGQ